MPSSGSKENNRVQESLYVILLKRDILTVYRGLEQRFGKHYGDGFSMLLPFGNDFDLAGGRFVCKSNLLYRSDNPGNEVFLFKSELRTGQVFLIDYDLMISISFSSASERVRSQISTFILPADRNSSFNFSSNVDC